MSSIDRVVLSAGAASAVGDVIECSGIAHLQLFIKVTGPALTGSLAIATTPDGTGDLSSATNAPALLTASNVTEVTARPASFGASVPTDATYVMTAVPTGSLFAVRIVNPPHYVVTRFAYGSGGDATTKVLVYAYGFMVKT